MKTVLTAALLLVSPVLWAEKIEIKDLGITTGVDILSGKTVTEFKWKGEDLKIEIGDLEAFAQSYIRRTVFDAEKNCYVGSKKYVLRSRDYKLPEPIKWNGLTLTDVHIFESGGDKYLLTLRRGKVIPGADGYVDAVQIVAEVFSQKDQKSVLKEEAGYQFYASPFFRSFTVKDRKAVMTYENGVIWFDLAAATIGSQSFTGTAGSEYFGLGPVVTLPTGDLAVSLNHVIVGSDKLRYEMFLPHQGKTVEIGSIHTSPEFTHLNGVDYITGKDHYMLMIHGENWNDTNRTWDDVLIGMRFDPVKLEGKEIHVALTRTQKYTQFPNNEFRTFQLGGEEYLLIYSGTYTADDRIIVIRAKDGLIIANKVFAGSSDRKNTNQGFKLVEDPKTGALTIEVTYTNIKKKDRVDMQRYQIVSPK